MMLFGKRIEHPREGCVRSGVEQHEAHGQRGGTVGQEAARFVQGILGGQIDREAVDAGADRGEGDARAVMLHGQFQAASVGGAQQVGLTFPAAAPDGADRVEDELRRQRPGRTRDGIAGRAAERIAFASLLMDSRSRRAMNRPVDSAADVQLRVGGVHDRIDLLARDVPLHEFDVAGSKVDSHRAISPGHSDPVRHVARALQRSSVNVSRPRLTV